LSLTEKEQACVLIKWILRTSVQRLAKIGLGIRMKLFVRFLLSVSFAVSGLASAQTEKSTAAVNAENVRLSVRADRDRYLKSLEDLVNIESGSRDLEGLAKAAAWVSQRLQSAGMSVETLPMKAPANHILLKGATLGSAV
jgi:hypothetical protein